MREHLGLVGAKYSCGISRCGACKVQVDGVPVNSCSVRTADVEGRAILTIEDNYIGGLHGEIAEAAALAGDVRVAGMTVRRIPKSARSAEEVFEYVGVGLEQIVQRATELTRS